MLLLKYDDLLKGALGIPIGLFSCESTVYYFER